MAVFRVLLFMSVAAATGAAVTKLCQAARKGSKKIVVAVRCCTKKGREKERQKRIERWKTHSVRNFFTNEYGYIYVNIDDGHWDWERLDVYMLSYFDKHMGKKVTSKFLKDDEAYDKRIQFIAEMGKIYGSVSQLLNQKSSHPGGTDLYTRHDPSTLSQENLREHKKKGHVIACVSPV